MTAAPHGDEGVNFDGLEGFIDLKDGLLRCRGITSRYADLLKMFLLNYRDFPARAISLYEMEEWGQLGKAVHSLRGVAGNLGARKLFKAARVFQLVLEQAEIEPRLTAFEHFLDSTRELLTALQAWEARQPIDTLVRLNDTELSLVVGMDKATASLDELLDCLANCLATHNLEADTLWLHISHRLPGYGRDPLLAEVNRAIRSLDYDDALRTLRRWKRHTV